MNKNDIELKNLINKWLDSIQTPDEEFEILNFLQKMYILGIFDEIEIMYNDQKIGGGIFGSIKSGVKKALLYAYQKLANRWRSRNCSAKARPLFPGEIHSLCSNYSGQ